MLLTSGLDMNLDEHPILANGGGVLSGPVHMNSLAFLLVGRRLDVADPPYTGTRRDGLEDVCVTCLQLYLYISIYRGSVLQHEYH